jgi:hypothetical protein
MPFFLTPSSFFLWTEQAGTVKITNPTTQKYVQIPGSRSYHYTYTIQSLKAPNEHKGSNIKI